MRFLCCIVLASLAILASVSCFPVSVEDGNRMNDGWTPNSEPIPQRVRRAGPVLDKTWNIEAVAKAFTPEGVVKNVKEKEFLKTYAQFKTRSNILSQTKASFPAFIKAEIQKAEDQKKEKENLEGLYKMFCGVMGEKPEPL